ncbi:oxygen-insensitive NAD(P)H-dependent nitroreductase NfsB [Henriciella marina]|uniref:oxygen-insensitive NAD(P)H-dependent nitroreductase NfsB n=1 Tax=Henriciella marina TaxID=453851 RepID=UPI0003722E70|nr:oxygen-insensitive NAD(P)H-dependent nitroreductase NfsB [Henriciella marina]
MTQLATDIRPDIIDVVKTRYTAKAFDASKTIPADIVEKLKALLQYSPSSTNVQPWHFILAATPDGKARVAKSTEEKFPFNTQSLLDASHTVVFASRIAADEDYMLDVLDQEDRDGRFDFDKDTLKPQTHGARNLFANIHKHDLKDFQHWADKQVYLNIGQFMLGAAALGVDARPMEGIDTKVLDEEFGLREKGYTSLVVIALGYRDEANDFNAKTPKSRLPLSVTLTEV